jgi:hypothetical protein
VSSLLDQIAAELTLDPNSTRIKKLLLYVCSGTWESDSDRLKQISLRFLLQQLFEGSPNLEALQQRLNQVVATLNKSAEYTILATAIMSRCAGFYAKLPQGQPGLLNPTLALQIAQNLAAEPQHTRIKKLLLLTCRSRWENNPTQLDSISFEQLVPELYQIAPTLDRLQATLVQVAQALSKPGEYVEIAHRVVNAFQPLYAEQPCLELGSTEPWLEPPTIWLGQPHPPAGGGSLELPPMQIQTAIEPPPDAPSPSYADSLSEFKTCTMTEPESIAHPIPEADLPPIAAPVPAPVADSLQSDHKPIPAVPFPASAASTASTTSQRPPRVLTIAQPQKLTDLFNLRLEIMQDTNPFKVKILLFSILHEPFRWDADHEALLKSHELDDLLRILFISYRLYSDVEQKLRQAAQTLSATEYSQAAEALLRIIQPCYTEMLVSPTLVPVSSAPATEITSMKADTHEITQPDRPISS